MKWCSILIQKDLLASSFGNRDWLLPSPLTRPVTGVSAVALVGLQHGQDSLPQGAPNRAQRSFDDVSTIRPSEPAPSAPPNWSAKNAPNPSSANALNPRQDQSSPAPRPINPVVVVGTTKLVVVVAMTSPVVVVGTTKLVELQSRTTSHSPPIVPVTRNKKQSWCVS
jgi:hypothetical protein